MSDTHVEYVGDGYSVRVQHCEGCNVYLGVNYPSDKCSTCKEAS